MIRLTLSCSIFLFISVSSYTPPNMGGAVGCVVTKNRLYSHGNLIRALTKEEMKILRKYKKDMAAFKKKIEDALENADNVETKNSTIPQMPNRPSMPAFCSGADTTMYIFGGCTIQNHKVYIGKTLAREMDDEEKQKLATFVAKMAEQQKNGIASTDLYKGLDFCTEFS